METNATPLDETTLSVWEQLAGAVERFQAQLRDLPVHSQVPPHEVRSALQKRYDFSLPIPRETLSYNPGPDDIEVLIAELETARLRLLG